MYEVIPPATYRALQPDDLTHAGSEGWTHAPVPGWGINPDRVGPRMLGAFEEVPPSRLDEALARAAKGLVFTTSPPPPPFVPYPVHRQVPSVMFNEVTAQSAAPWGRFPGGRAYDGVGAYYSGPTTQPIGALGAYYSAPTTRPVGEVEVVPAAGLALTGGMLVLALAAPLLLGGLGYWVGGKVAPSPAQQRTYRWAGALANVVAPGVGLVILAMIGAAKAGEVHPNRRRRVRRNRTQTRRKKAARPRARRPR
jgi:hypothetical protein